jgi:hypothetical protein
VSKLMQQVEAGEDSANSRITSFTRRGIEEQPAVPAE